MRAKEAGVFKTEIIIKKKKKSQPLLFETNYCGQKCLCQTCILVNSIRVKLVFLRGHYIEAEIK